METITIARTAGNKLARRSALELQAALAARGIEVTVRVLRADFEQDFEVAIARVRAWGVNAVEVPMAIVDARYDALRELAALNG